VTPVQYADFVEAAVRSGHEDEAARWVAEMGRRADVNGSTWYRGLTLRSRALVAPPDEAEDHFRAAVAALSDTGAVIDLARAHLLYGEWLRRQNRRVDARSHLHTANDMLVAMGADGFADQARHELAATGETARRRSVDTLLELTAQEAHIARLAAEGRTNPEIAAQLYVSPRTVEWHMSKIFSKLGVSSRRRLAQALRTSSA